MKIDIQKKISRNKDFFKSQKVYEIPILQQLYNVCVYISDDWTKLEQTESRQLYFARKFEPIIHADILDR